MPLNPYFTSEFNSQGTANEQLVLADLIEEAIQINGQEFYYVPRVLVAKDEILGEDRLSKFLNAYAIEMYIETPMGFEGQGEFMSKFGLYIEQSMVVMLSRRRWQELVGRDNRTILSTRPAEGDLVYHPISKRLFEIKYVEKETSFFQLGQLATWKMTLELFQYASERLDTGVAEIDAFETLKSFDESQLSDVVDSDGNVGIDIPDNFGDNEKLKVEAPNVIFDANNPFGDPI